MTLSPHKDPQVVDVARQELAVLRSTSTSLLNASLLSDDGFEIARVTSDGTLSDGARFASMASSIQALAEAVARELAMGDSEYVIVAAERGHLVQIRIPHQPIVLAATFDKDELLGKALTLSRRCATAIAANLVAARAVPVS